MLLSFILYMSVFLIVTALLSLSKKSTKILKIIIITTSICLLSLLAAVRYNVGTDYNSYFQIYNSINNNFSNILIFNFYQEPGNVIIYRLSYLIFNNYKSMFFIFSFITSTFFVLGIIKYEKIINVKLSIFMFLSMYFLVSLNGMRQMLAVSLLFYGSFYLVSNKSIIKFLIIIAIAGLFHKSAYFMIFLIPYYYYIKDKTIQKSYIIVLFITLIGVPLIAYSAATLSSVLGIYSSYVTYDGQKNVLFLLYILPSIIIYIISLKNSFKNANSNTGNVYFKLYILSIPLQFLGYFYSYFDRFSLYTLVFQCLAIPISVKNIKSNSTKSMVLLLTYSWVIFYHVIMFIILGSNGVYPFIFA